ncbi:MAG: O-acetylhomoserine aminocarboxypropyltransferase/cysteine synthase [Candidatus Delongbacteria bacterium]|nr:O-acetylhomoserine aminocarboxypropyltransferase/cysteine synthase [Candidatus Delongbacteria bacterium]MBN2834848.1 O-acetylhomoserine aminocarboxypropyltransferase/cysteine synthase [Candidatus Delongbacteria bacterium]
MGKFQTQAIHEGYDGDPTTGSVAIPVYQTASYKFRNSDHAASLFNLEDTGNIYTRITNPTIDILEKRLASLEKGKNALAFSSGSAAITAVFLTILKSGDRILSSSHLYGGTYNLFSVFFKRLGIETDFADAGNFDSFISLFHENTKAIYLETIGNPSLSVPDFEKYSQFAREKKIPLIVDNTVASPVLCNPIEHGANIVVHSLTKYIGGQGNSLGGVIVDGGNFDWNNGNFPEFTTPSEGYHGLVYYDLFGRDSFIYKARLETLRDTGACLSPFNAFQILQGIETLYLRVKAHSENAEKVASFLREHSKIVSVNYPNSEFADKYLPNGRSGIVTAEIKGGYEAAKKFADSLKLFSIVANIGDTRSLIIHPASTTHQQLSREERLSCGVNDGLVRLSIGLENISDIIEDLNNGLKGV